MKDNQYSGETALHAAIAKCKVDLVTALLAGGADTEAEVTGSFFARDGPCYLGGLPLMFAVATDQAEMVKILVAHDESVINLQDRFGNTVMHIAVIWKKKEMYKFLLLYKPRMKEGLQKSTRQQSGQKTKNAENEDVPLHTILNGKESDAAGTRRSAISITSSTNDPDMLEFLADVHGYTLWEFSNVSCKAFVVAELDAVARSIFLDDSWDLLLVPVMHKYFLTKWQLYGYKYFCIEAMITFLYMCLYTATVLESSLSQEATRIIESVCIAMASFYMIREVNRLRIFYNLGGWPALNDLFEGIQLLRVLSWIHCALLLVTLPVSWAVVADKDDRNSLRAASIGFLYSYSLFFIALLPSGRLNLNLGPFITMIMKVLTDDILKVGIIYSIFLGTFSLVIWLARGDVTDLDPEIDLSAYATLPPLSQRTST
jgi:hypothetical protein